MWNPKIPRLRVQRAGCVLLALSLFAVSPCWAKEACAKADASVTTFADALKSSGPSAAEQVEHVAQYLAVLGTIITLIGGGVTLLPKLAESFSLRSRRKSELDRVEALAELMAKIKNDDALTVATRESVGLQIDAEIAEALEGLEDYRLKRQQALKAKTAKQQPDLTFAQRAFLWYLPHGTRGWLAHVLAFSMAGSGLLLALLGIAFSEGSEDDFWFIVTIVAVVILWWLPFRAWALRERRRWRTAHPQQVIAREQVAASA